MRTISRKIPKIGEKISQLEQQWLHILFPIDMDEGLRKKQRQTSVIDRHDQSSITACG